ncbi:MAG: carbon starvation protein A [Candidatus Cloacimonetes bacterium]|nr:carbon starvation protein A [Candidatus Cloacimonadota bacterium]
MSVLSIILICGIVYLVAYILYGRFLAKKVYHLEDSQVTPAVTINDDVDYVPTKKGYLTAQHFSNITAAGPINGPILAAGMFGWFPALLWCVFGTIFIGGVHDMGSLIASARNKAKSITTTIRENVSKRAWALFMLFLWMTLIYLIIAFTDITASSMVGIQSLSDGSTVYRGGIATSSFMYIFLALIMGCVIHYTKLSEKWALMIFTPMIIVVTWLGQKMPLDIDFLFPGHAVFQQQFWGVLILTYCFLAALLPMWLLLQPRGAMGAYFKWGMILVAGFGLLFGNFQADFDSAFTTYAPGGNPLFPILFITIACGACSGFHAIVASGTTSKQLKFESHAKPVGYGSMLLEGLLACVSISCIMIFAARAPEIWNSTTNSALAPNFIYAHGMGKFLSIFGVPLALGVSFGLMAFTTFVFDTLDICVRLGKYIFEELTNIKGMMATMLGAFITASLPVFFIFQTMSDDMGNAIPAWRIFWNLFGSANQLLAALSLTGISIWLKNDYKKSWGWLATLIPAIFMYIMSVWSLFIMIFNGWKLQKGHFILPYIASLLVILAAIVGVETLICMIKKKKFKN